MTELEAWKHIKKNWKKAKKLLVDNVSYALYETEAGSGLCADIEALWDDNEIELGTYLNLQLKICNYTPKNYKHPYSDLNYRWPTNAKGKRSRIAFCNKMIRMLEKEK